MFNYGAWVGLAHDRYGDLRLGRQYTVGKTCLLYTSGQYPHLGQDL